MDELLRQALEILGARQREQALQIFIDDVNEAARLLGEEIRKDTEKNLSELEQIVEANRPAAKVSQGAIPILGKMEHVLALPDGELSKTLDGQGCGPTALAAAGEEGGGGVPVAVWIGVGAVCVGLAGFGVWRFLLRGRG